ncbi:MAG: hypothetical protein R6V85_20290 [Polyangia bacterium]
MSGAEQVRCPTCSGPVGVSELDRVVTCSWCGARAVVEGLPFVPEYRVAPRVDAVAARRAVQRLLRSDPLPGGLLRSSRFRSAELYYVPYNEIGARRSGLMVIDKLGPGASRGSKRPAADTRVVDGEIHRVEPAVRMPDWALEHSALLESGDAGLALEPCERAALAREGRVLHPTIGAERIVEQLGGTHLAATVDDETEISERRVRRVFYPVWRAVYEHHGRLYRVTVDGVTGRTMGARAPQDDRRRVGWLIGAALLVGILAGGLLRGVAAVLGDAGASSILLGSGESWAALAVVVAVLGLSAMVVVAIAWEQFRYPGELVLRGDRIQVEKLNAPPQNSILKAVSSLSDRLGGLFERSDPDGWR